MKLRNWTVVVGKIAVCPELQMVCLEEHTSVLVLSGQSILNWTWLSSSFIVFQLIYDISKQEIESLYYCTSKKYIFILVEVRELNDNYQDPSYLKWRVRNGWNMTCIRQKYLILLRPPHSSVYILIFTGWIYFSLRLKRIFCHGKYSNLRSITRTTKTSVVLIKSREYKTGEMVAVIAITRTASSTYRISRCWCTHMTM